MNRRLSFRSRIRSSAGLSFGLMFGLLIQPTLLLAAVQEQTSGPVSVKLELLPEKPVIGDTLTLSIEVIAESEVEVLMPEFGSALDRFSIVDFAPRETIDDEGRTVARQTYRLDAPSSGSQVIPPILIEYVDRREGKKPSPDDLDAYEILTDRIPFEVQSVLPGETSLDLKPPMEALDPNPTAPSASWPWFLLVGLVLLAIVPFLVKAFLAAQRRRRRRSAYDVAKSRLQTILKAPRGTQDQVERFYVALSSVIRQYIEDRFDMRAPDLTTEEFLASIGESPDFTPEHQGLLREFLKQADLVKFARAEPSPDETQRAIDKAERFLDETSADAPLIEAENDSVDQQRDSIGQQSASEVKDE